MDAIEDTTAGYLYLMVNNESWCQGQRFLAGRHRLSCSTHVPELKAQRRAQGPTARLLPCLQARYLNKMLHGYLKYGLPLWLTEFSCADDPTLTSEAGQRAYLPEALLLLELHPSVERYAW